MLMTVFIAFKDLVGSRSYKFTKAEELDLGVARSI
jgi:hypothetical protein